MVDHTVPLLPNSDSVLSDIGSGTGLVWVNATILIVNIVIFVYQRYESHKFRRIALKDDFWFRSIALPIILDPLKKFSDDQTRKIRELITDTSADSEAYESYFEKCQSDIHNLIAGCYVMRIHSVPLYEELIEQLELMEDKVAEYCMNRGAIEVHTPSVFAHAHMEMISIIMKFHDKNKFV